MTFNIWWELAQYTKSELEENENLLRVLTVSGDIIDAEASSCLDYSRRIWPLIGEFVIMALENAIKTGWHCKYSNLLPKNLKLTSIKTESSPFGTTISCRLWEKGVSHLKEKATVIVDGSRNEVIGIAQQLAWLSTIFRIPSEGNFARSEFIIHEKRDSTVFNLKLLPLRDIRATPQACWHPLFLNTVLAYRFPIRSRDGEVVWSFPSRR
jgi:hypothetical protein